MGINENHLSNSSKPYSWSWDHCYTYLASFKIFIPVKNDLFLPRPVYPLFTIVPHANIYHLESQSQHYQGFLQFPPSLIESYRPCHSLLKDAFKISFFLLWTHILVSRIILLFGCNTKLSGASIQSKWIIIVILAVSVLLLLLLFMLNLSPTNTWPALMTSFNVEDTRWIHFFSTFSTSSFILASDFLSE